MLHRYGYITVQNIENLDKFVNEGNYYGAQQMYKSISARCVSAKRYSEALDILHSGACIQLSNGQIVSRKSKSFPQVPLPQHLWDVDDMQKLSDNIGSAKIRVEGCSSFLKAAIKLSGENGKNSHGSPELHITLAEYIFSESPEVIDLLGALIGEDLGNLEAMVWMLGGSN
ncbi:hypothetical protein RJT34_24753 [Clitoria ternatea]|uniref:Uncharacterized protein n=1 Tax=Clitoria ternatea TaxID=43366 RepID=A0AAN9FR92_CLITE